MSSLRNILILLTALVLTSCQVDPITTDPQDLSEAERQELGDVLLEALKSDASNIAFYPEESFPQLYEHFDNLYRQVYLIDRDVAMWPTDHEIEVLIIRNNEQIATCLPGGHFVISQGLANLFTFEYELIYVMAFEFNLMLNGDLLENMGQFVRNITELRDIAENGDVDRATEIALDLLRHEIVFEADLVSLNDERTVNTICGNTNYKVDGYREFFEELIPPDQWDITRKSFPNREQALIDYMVETKCTGEDRVRATTLGENYYEDVIKNFLRN